MNRERTVRVLTRKWPDGPHWEFEGVRLGADGFGNWIGVAEGTLLRRPGMQMTAVAGHVVLVPHDAWWVATFYGSDHQRPFDTYVDITTPAVWDAGETEIRAVDLDLDVIKGTTGRVWVDDEHEFAEHRVALGYPEHVVEAAVRSCEGVLRAVTNAEAPYDGTAGGWLARL